jgi:hypothetical protein
MEDGHGSGVVIMEDKVVTRWVMAKVPRRCFDDGDKYEEGGKYNGESGGGGKDRKAWGELGGACVDRGHSHWIRARSGPSCVPGVVKEWLAMWIGLCGGKWCVDRGGCV